MTIIDSLKRLSGKAVDSSEAQPTSAKTPGSPHTNTWQDVFNPGRNYNMKGAYFDNVSHDPASPKGTSVWEEHLKSKSAAGVSTDKAVPSGLKADAIREMFSQDKIDRVLAMNEGKDMDMNAFLSQLKGMH